MHRLANMWRSQQGKSKEDDGDELIDISNDSGDDYSEMDNESE